MFGRRTIKTAISVMTSLFVANLFGLEPAVFAAIAAALSIQPTNQRSLRYAMEQMQANIVGAIVAILVAFLFGIHLYTVALAIMIVITLANVFKWQESIPLSIVTVIFLMEAPTDNFFHYAWNRFLITFLGVGISGMINLVLLPPKFVSHLRREYEQALKLLIVYYSNWQMHGVFQLNEMNQLKAIIKRTHQFEQWMKEQSKSEVHPPGYYKGLHIEASKNEILSDFLLVTEHYGSIPWKNREDVTYGRKQIKELYEQVLAVMAHTSPPKGYNIDLDWWQERFIEFADDRKIKHSFLEILAALVRLEKKLRRYSRYIGQEKTFPLIEEENRWLSWRFRW